jgi:hypothetical protein
MQKYTQIKKYIREAKGEAILKTIELEEIQEAIQFQIFINERDERLEEQRDLMLSIISRYNLMNKDDFTNFLKLLQLLKKMGE